MRACAGVRDGEASTSAINDPPNMDAAAKQRANSNRPDIILSTRVVGMNV
jgi:hypothetical protein